MFSDLNKWDIKSQNYIISKQFYMNVVEKRSKAMDFKTICFTPFCIEMLFIN